jgi:hypothetical protein
MRLASLLPHKFRFFDQFQLGGLARIFRPRIRGHAVPINWLAEALPGEQQPPLELAETFLELF